MFEKKLDSHHYRLFTGKYINMRSNQIFSEESFQVLRDRREHNIIFRSEIDGRVITGELLSMKVEYIINKEYIPIHVSILKSLGEERSFEVFEFNHRKNLLKYTFINKNEEAEEIEISSVPRFAINTPATAPSLTFLRSKKFDSTGENHYQCWKSQNMWQYEGPPKLHDITLVKVGQGFESILIGGQNLQCIEYRVFETVKDDQKSSKNKGSTKDLPHLKIYMSKHLTLPYQVRDMDGTKTEIKHLKDHEGG